MRLVNNKQSCCGCMACASVCGAGAITEYTDENGFVYPSVNEDLCVNCGACQRICAFSKPADESRAVRSAYAFQLKDKETLMKCTSGGAFIALSDLVLEKGGMVVGAVMDEHFTVYHTLACDKTARDRMCGSKYVQSSVDGVFQIIKERLNEHIPVLFSGTPCQAAELLAYVGGGRDELIICDFLCHGVPSNRLFKDHIKYLEARYKKKAVDYSFRGKHFGWDHIEGVSFENGKTVYSKHVQAYRRFFYYNVSLRPSCLNCKYRGGHRYSDITFGDFWNIGNVTKKNNKMGYSLLLANTEKGEKLLEELPRRGELIGVPLEKVQSRLSSDAVKSKIDGTEFWNVYGTKGYEGLVNTYAKTSAWERAKFGGKNLVKRTIFLIRGSKWA